MLFPVVYVMLTAIKPPFSFYCREAAKPRTAAFMAVVPTQEYAADDYQFNQALDNATGSGPETIPRPEALKAPVVPEPVSDD
jgi:hypothetical protein